MLDLIVALLAIVAAVLVTLLPRGYLVRTRRISDRHGVLTSSRRR